MASRQWRLPATRRPTFSSASGLSVRWLLMLSPFCQLLLLGRKFSSSLSLSKLPRKSVELKGRAAAVMLGCRRRWRAVTVGLVAAPVTVLLLAARPLQYVAVPS